MAAFNKVILCGNLTRDPQLKQLPSNTQLAEFGLAINRRFKTSTGEDREEVCFVDCTAFGKQAEVIAQYCQKGKALLVEGRLKYETWDDKRGLGNRSKLSVVVENFQFIGGKLDELGQGQQQAAPRQQQRPQQQARPQQRQVTQQQPFGNEEVFKEADIPF
jgi:single-strand DNA-binding protein